MRNILRIMAEAAVIWVAGSLVVTYGVCLLARFVRRNEGSDE